MEGRKSFPIASHPFPNAPDMTKFWGTPRQWALLKVSLVYIGIAGTLLGIKRYLKRHERPAALELSDAEISLFNNRMMSAKEASRDLFSSGTRIKRMGEKPNILNPKLNFDDSIRFKAPHKAEHLPFEN